MIIDYCAALTVVMTEDATDDPRPILLNIADLHQYQYIPQQ